MPIDVITHASDRILEVVYPAQLSLAEVEDYVQRMRALIDGMGGPWRALVDQSRLRALPREAVPVMVSLNIHAERNGMERSARLVADAVSGLNAWRWTKMAGLTIPVCTFTNRDEALAWLKAEEP